MEVGQGHQRNYGKEKFWFSNVFRGIEMENWLEMSGAIPPLFFYFYC